MKVINVETAPDTSLVEGTFTVDYSDRDDREFGFPAEKDDRVSRADTPIDEGFPEEAERKKKFAEIVKRFSGLEARTSSDGESTKAQKE